MEQQAVLSSRSDLKTSLSREEIRSRLARPRVPKARGDVATAMKLMAQGGLTVHDDATFGALPTSGIPYAQGAGAAGARVKFKPAAVLVPLIEEREGFAVMLTQRTADLKHHAGQISFPGGRMEENDADVVACALRETEEETGLSGASVEILGQLDPYVTITGYEVTPVVGAVTPPFTLKPDPVEVAHIFEVPLAFLLDPANHQRVEREVKGIKRAYYAMPYGPHYIWGATAGMILNMFEILSA